MRAIKVFIVDDHSILVEGLVNILKSEATIELVGYALNTHDCTHFLHYNQVDVILMDINLGEESGLDLCKTVKQINADINIVAISSHIQGSFIENMLHNGASGYLYKNSNKEEIISAIQEAYQGSIYLSSEAKTNYHHYLVQKAQRPVVTKRELEILNLIRQGHKNTDIGKMLFISIDTVDTHRKNLYTKLKVNNTASLIQKATELEMF